MLTFNSRRYLLLCRWKTLVTVLDMLGFRQLTVFGKMGKIGCQSALYLGESFCLEGTANVTCIDKHVTYDRKVIGITLSACWS